MNLHFIGRGAAFNTKEGNNSAYFIENDCLFLIDCGESVFADLMNNHILSSIQHIYVIISHTHSDHCGSLGSLGFYCQYVLHRKLHIVVPHHETYINSLKTLMSLFGNSDEAYTFVYEEEIDHVFSSFSSIRYDLTQHDDHLICFSFVFETHHGAIFYSADTKTADNMIHFMNTHHDIDRMYMEVTDLKIPDDVHLNIENLETVIPLPMRHKVWLMHLRSEECVKLAQEKKFQIVSRVNNNIS